MRSRSGLTFFEVVIVIAVLAVVTVITLPKFRLMLYESREARTKTNLADIRGALAIYYSDNYGLYPADDGTPETRLSSALVPYYLKEMFPVELAHIHPEKLNTVQDRFDDKGDWVYSTLNGFVAVNCTHEDTAGAIISNW